MVFSSYFLLHLTWESIDDGDGFRRFLRVWRLMGVSSLWSKQKLLGHACVLLYVYVLHVNSQGTARHPLWVVSTCLLSQHQPPTTNPRTMAFWRVLLTKGIVCCSRAEPGIGTHGSRELGSSPDFSPGQNQDISMAQPHSAFDDSKLRWLPVLFYYFWKTT